MLSEKTEYALSLFAEKNYGGLAIMSSIIQTMPRVRPNCELKFSRNNDNPKKTTTCYGSTGTRNTHETFHPLENHSIDHPACGGHFLGIHSLQYSEDAPLGPEAYRASNGGPCP
jgi:hypothetical protein